MKIALCGPPQSGKSVLRERLKSALLALDPTFYPYVITANPDGEGSWFQQAVHTDPDAAQAAKKLAKQNWTDAHADKYASDVRNVTLPLTFIDLGGRVDPKNYRICALATHAILIAPSIEAFEEWRHFATTCGLKILAELISDYHGAQDSVESTGPPLRASIHHLERGDIASTRPAITALAEVILDCLRLELRR